MTEEATTDQSSVVLPPPVEWATFLVQYPPASVAVIKNISRGHYVSSGNPRAALSRPVLVLPCDSDACGGLRYFDCRTAEFHVPVDSPDECFLAYECRHCHETKKTYALAFNVSNSRTIGSATKIGEFPPFGPRVPPRVLRLIQPDHENFLKGRRAESQGLGIGAFAYYRRVVENQKDRLFDKLISVAQTVGISSDRCNALEEAKSGFQFRNAVAEFKDLIPDSLLIKGHNPLTLLHTALSRGMHSESDDECLDLARDIRAILTMFAEKLAQALSDDAELNQAISHLTGAGQTDTSAGDGDDDQRGDVS